MDAVALTQKVKQFAGDRNEQQLDDVIAGILDLETITDLTHLLERI
jgi:hypothetical protein